jgi:2-polyprenyl-6-methoxyphenol hydroxylase-like FAD-dependent oxidoreductase
MRYPADARTAVHDMHVAGRRQPGAVLDFSAWTQGVGELAWIVDAAELERALRTAVRFAPHLHDGGPPVPAALHGAGRRQGLGHARRAGRAMPRQAYGQRGIAARLLTDQPHNGLARQWFRSPDVLALLPLDRPQARPRLRPGVVGARRACR